MLPVSYLLLGVALGASPEPTVPALNLQRGEEWTYRGHVSEAIDRLDVRFRRRHEMEVRVLTLERRATFTDLAILTLLTRTDDLVSEALPAVSGTLERSPAPPAVRLDLVRRFADGQVRLLVPQATLPMVLNGVTPTTPVPGVPLDSFSPSEFGILPPVGWNANGEDFVAGERCLMQQQIRQTRTWADPRGGQTAVRHEETAWLSTRDGSVRRVHRVIHHRDGFKANPSATVELHLEVDRRSPVDGREFERYQQDVEVAHVYGAELAAWLPDAVKLGPSPFAARLARLDAYVRENPPGTPYRKAVLSVKRRFEAARAGDAVPLAALKVGAGVTVSPVGPSGVRTTAAP